MDLAQYVAIIRRRWLLLVVLTLAGAMAGFAVAYSTPNMYRATSSVFVSAERGETTVELMQGTTFTQNLIQSYAELAKMPSVLEPVITKLDLPLTSRELARAITVDSPLDTVVIEITVQDRSPERAAQIANAVTSSLSMTAQSLSPKAANGTPAINMQQVAEAYPPEAPFAPDTKIYIGAGVLAGLVLGLAYVLGRELLDTRVRTEEDMTRNPDVPLLGSVPVGRNKALLPTVLASSPTGIHAEAYRRIAANLQYINPDAAARSVLVTSASSSEGKTTTAILLASALAERFDRVLLVDGDLRRPRVAEYCGIEGALGLTTVLAGGIKSGSAIVHWAGIDILPSGRIPPNPHQLASSEALADLVTSLMMEYDIVVIDSAPVLPVADSLVMARITDGAVVVGRANSTRRGLLKKAIESIDAVGASVLGLVLNGVKGSQAGYGSYREEQPTTTRYTRLSMNLKTAAHRSGQPDLTLVKRLQPKRSRP
jgi:capsular exopolysaccharide synthesis family protein